MTRQDIERVVGEEYDSLVRVARARLKHEDDARDVVQTVLLAFMESYEQIAQDADLRAYLVTAVVNRARNFMRDATRARAHAARALSEGSRFESPEELAMRMSELGRVLGLLQPDIRRAMYLVDVQGHSIAEAASKLGVPANVLRVRLQRARKWVREALTPRDPEVPFGGARQEAGDDDL